MILLYDGNNTLIRNNAVTELYHNGIRTSGISGMLSQLLSDITTLQNKNTIDKVIVLWDGGSKYRKDLYPEYKAHRIAKKEKELEDGSSYYDELKYQLEEMHKFLPNIGIHSLRIIGWEADDLIASIVGMTQEPCIIVTTDKDLMQLVDERVSVYQPTKKILYTKDNFYTSIGIHPTQFVDYKILIGDPSDNIPGIKGIGNKTAIKLLNQYGSIPGILRNKQELLKSKITSKIFLPENLGIITFNRALIDLSFPEKEEINPTIKECITENLVANTKELIKFASKHGLSRIIMNIKEWKHMLYNIQDTQKPE
jgi:gp32.85